MSPRKRYWHFLGGRVRIANLISSWRVSFHKGGRDHSDEREVFIGEHIGLTPGSEDPRVEVLALYIPKNPS